MAKKTGHHPAQEIATAPEFAGWHYPGCIMMQRMERMDIYIYMVTICVSYIVYYVMDIYVMYIYIYNYVATIRGSIRMEMCIHGTQEIESTH